MDYTRIEIAVRELFGSTLSRDVDGDIYSGPRWKHVELVVRALEADLLQVSHIETEPRSRRLGLASEVLRDQCAWADANGIRLLLYPHRSSIAGGAAPNDDQLAIWYEAFDFKSIEHLMMRLPNRNSSETECSNE